MKNKTVEKIKKNITNIFLMIAVTVGAIAEKNTIFNGITLLLVFSMWQKEDKEKPIKYDYLINYMFNNGDGQGTLAVYYSKKIDAREDVLALGEYIKKENGFEQVGVTSYQLINEIYEEGEDNGTM